LAATKLTVLGTPKLKHHSLLVSPFRRVRSVKEISGHGIVGVGEAGDGGAGCGVGGSGVGGVGGGGTGGGRRGGEGASGGGGLVKRLIIYEMNAAATYARHNTRA